MAETFPTKGPFSQAKALGLWRVVSRCFEAIIPDHYHRSLPPHPIPIPRLNRAPPTSKPWGNRRITMLALGIIFGFIAVMALMNFVEFGRVD